MSIPDPSSCESLVFVSKPRVTVYVKVKGYIGIGHAFCHPADEWSSSFGSALAWARAYEDALLASTQPESPCADTGLFDSLRQAVDTGAFAEVLLALPFNLHLVSKSGGQP